MKRFCFFLIFCLLLGGCAAPEAAPDPQLRTLPTLPPHLTLDEGGRPLLSVYVAEENTVREMDAETYVMGVVAGEIPNDWPLEALKAQAILARTFVMRFVSERKSRYEGVDISTDIAEAQAYNRSRINDRVRQAVRETAGQVLVTPAGNLPYTWFHAHAGGMTALAREGLDWQEAEPAYTKVGPGLESDAAPASAKAWKAAFSRKDFLAACRRAGAKLETMTEVAITEKGPSGRAVTLTVDGVDINAAQLRLELGSTVMRSTLLTELDFDGQTVTMAGKGYGHGVGMPQWGAYALAMDGKTGIEIALHYYDGLEVAQLWDDATAADASL